MFKSAFVLVLLLLPYSVLGEDKTAEFTRDLDMKMSLSAEEVVQFEPVVLKVSIRNASHQPQKIYRALDPKWQYLKVFVIDAEGEHQEIKTSRVANDKVESMELATWVNRDNDVGTGVHRRILLTPYPGNWLDTPGKYKVYVTFNYDEGKKAGSPSAAELTVKPAEGVNKEALKRFRGVPQAKFLARETTRLDIASEFMAVIQPYTLHPETPNAYVPWCYYILGRYYQDRQVGDADTNARNARMHYKTLLKQFPDFPLKIEVQYEIARESFRLKKTDESFYEVKRLIKIDPEEENFGAELFLFYEARRALDSAGDAITAEDLPSH